MLEIIAIAMSIIVTTLQITYGSPSWRRFINSDEEKKFANILNNTKRSNFLPSEFSALKNYSTQPILLCSIQFLTIPEHVLHPLLPPRKKTGYNLRKHSHGLMLPEAKFSFLQNNFLVRMLYTDFY